MCALSMSAVLCSKMFAQKNTSFQNQMGSRAAPPGAASTVVLPASVELSTTAAATTPSHNKDPNTCTICRKTFPDRAHLTRHMRTHTGEKPYTCEICQKAFAIKENLMVHRRIHTKERPYKCEVCASAFEHSGKLRRHMRTHTGERPHKCSMCEKTFVQSGQLTIHTRTHTGEKPYVCDVCQKGFTCANQLKVHFRTHTGERPYSCDICGKTFSYNHVRNLHQAGHFGQKVYKCRLCHVTFSSKKAMDAHIKTHKGAEMALQSAPMVPLPYDQPQDLRIGRGSIDPALMAVTDSAQRCVGAMDFECDSRSSSATPPLCVDEEAPPIEPMVRLCPKPLSMLPAAALQLEH